MSRLFVSVALRLGIAWLVLAGIGLTCGSTLVRGCLPMIEQATQWLLPGYRTELALGPHDGDTKLQLELTALAGVRLGTEVVIPAGQSVTTRAGLLHTLVPPMILLCVLGAWPAGGWKRRVALLAAGVALAPVLLAVTVPVHLAGLLELSLAQAAEARGVDFGSALLDAMIFLESGGRWLLPLLFAIAAGSLLGQPLDRPGGPLAR